MSLSDDVDLEVFVMSKDDLSGKFDFFQDFLLNIFNLIQLPNDRQSSSTELLHNQQYNCSYLIIPSRTALYRTTLFYISGADIKAVCTEAGLLALRERRMRVTQEDFVKAKEKTLYRKKGNIPEGLYL